MWLCLRVEARGRKRVGWKEPEIRAGRGPAMARGGTVRTCACAPWSHDGVGGGFAAVGENPPTESRVATERSVVAALAWPRCMAAWKGERWTGRGRLSGSGSGGGGLLHARCLCVPLRDHAPPAATFAPSQGSRLTLGDLCRAGVRWEVVGRGWTWGRGGSPD